MAQLTVLTDLSGQVTRQDLFNMWADAALSAVSATDLAPNLGDVILASSFSDLTSQPPGKLVWVQEEQRMYCFHDDMDVLDNGDCTTVSLWLCIGPDRFETACLAGEPIPAGAVVEPFYDRIVKICRPEENTRGDSNTPIPIGINQSGTPGLHGVGFIGQTAESGTWIRVGIDGILSALHYRPEEIAPDTDVTHFRVQPQNSGGNWVGIMNGADDLVAGSVGGRTNSRLLAGAWTIGTTLHNWTVPSGITYAYFDLQWRGPVNFRT